MEDDSNNQDENGIDDQQVINKEKTLVFLFIGLVLLFPMAFFFLIKSEKIIEVSKLLKKTEIITGKITDTHENKLIKISGKTIPLMKVKPNFLNPPTHYQKKDKFLYYHLLIYPKGVDETKFVPFRVGEFVVKPDVKTKFIPNIIFNNKSDKTSQERSTLEGIKFYDTVLIIGTYKKEKDLKILKGEPLLLISSKNETETLAALKLEESAGAPKWLLKCFGFLCFFFGFAFVSYPFVKSADNLKDIPPFNSSLYNQLAFYSAIVLLSMILTLASKFWWITLIIFIIIITLAVRFAFTFSPIKKSALLPMAKGTGVITKSPAEKDTLPPIHR